MHADAMGEVFLALYHIFLILLKRVPTLNIPLFSCMGGWMYFTASALGTLTKLPIFSASPPDPPPPPLLMSHPKTERASFIFPSDRRSHRDRDLPTASLPMLVQTALKALKKDLLLSLPGIDDDDAIASEKDLS